MSSLFFGHSNALFVPRKADILLSFESQRFEHMFYLLLGLLKGRERVKFCHSHSTSLSVTGKSALRLIIY